MFFPFITHLYNGGIVGLHDLQDSSLGMSLNTILAVCDGCHALDR